MEGLSSMKNILFIIPPYFNIQDFICEEKKSILPTFTIPYGVLSIYSYIKKYSKYTVNAELLDLNLEIFKNINQNQYQVDFLIDSYKKLILEKLRKNFDIVAISALLVLSTTLCKFDKTASLNAPSLLELKPTTTPFYKI